MSALPQDQIRFPREVLSTATVGCWDQRVAKAAEELLMDIAQEMGRGIERLAQNLGDLPKLAVSGEAATGAPNIVAGIAQAIDTYTGR